MTSRHLGQKLRRRNLSLLLLWVLVVILGGALGYMAIDGSSFLEALYMTVITVSTVGFGELGHISQAGRLFTILLIGAGVTTFYFAGAVIGQAILANLPTRERKRMQKIIDDLSGHVILCGYGRFGQIVRQELEKADRAFVVIERDEVAATELAEEGVPCLHDDATHEETLVRAGIARASGVVAAVGTDAGNVFISLTARQLNPQCPIVARAEDPRSEQKLRMVGATQVVTPYIVGGRRLAQAFLRPGAIDLVDLAMGVGEQEVLIEEIPLPSRLPQDPCTLSGMELGARFRLIAVAVRPGGGEGALQFNPTATTPVHPGDQLLVMGERHQLDAFQRYLRELKG